MEAAFHKGIQSLDISALGLSLNEDLSGVENSELEKCIEVPTDRRFFELIELMRRGYSIAQLQEKTKIDFLYLTILNNLLLTEQNLKSETLNKQLLLEAKKYRFEDQVIAELSGLAEEDIVAMRLNDGIKPSYKMVDTCAGEFVAATNYVYSTYYGDNEIQPLEGEKKALIIGAGPIRIGQGVEFDYSGVKAIKRLQEKGFKTIMVNNNPETVSTDFETADRLYFEPITKESVLSIIQHESIDTVLVQFGGQTALNLAPILEAEGIILLGTSAEIIDSLEDRDRFYQLLDTLMIPHVKGDICHTKHEADASSQRINVSTPLPPFLCNRRKRDGKGGNSE